VRHLTPDDIDRITALADACCRAPIAPTGPAGPCVVKMSDVPSGPRPEYTALATAVGDLPAPARAELVALVWLGGDTNGDGRDPLGWQALVAHARAVSGGAAADGAYVAGKSRDLGVRLRAGLAALDAVGFN
jgi:hypothetical protein